jgi:peptide/nickel transport system substrate-binding protein
VRCAAVLLLLATGIAGCGSDAGLTPGEAAAPLRHGEPAYGDTMVEASIATVSGLIPNITSDNASHEVGSLLYTGLIKRDANLDFVGDLAERWVVSRDCRELTFHLRRDARWHDGRPFTAEDVLFTHRTMVHPKTPTAYREEFLAVEHIEAPDPHTVTVRYRQPYAKSMQSWEMWMLPRHLLERYVEEGRLREAPQNWQAPVGTGPYRFGELRAGEKVVLVANKDFYGPGPFISRVVYRIIPSQATIFMELKARGVDTSNLTALQYQRQSDYPAFRKIYRKYRYPSNSYTYLGFNLKDPRFADPRVRHAFAHAINKRELIDGVVLGLGREATGPYKPGTWVYNPDVRRFDHDPARAQALLAEAGWRERNADGLLVKDGQPFTFTLMTNQGNDERKKVAEMIQAALREVGVGVEIRTMEWSSFIKEYVRKRRFEAIVLGWGIGQDPDQYDIWHSSKTGPEQLNVVSYSNAEVDALLERGRASCVNEERKKYYDRIQQILAEDQPLIFLYFRDALPAVSARIHNIQESPNGIRFNFTEWFVPRSLQRYTAG